MGWAADVVSLIANVVTLRPAVPRHATGIDPAMLGAAAAGLRLIPCGCP